MPDDQLRWAEPEEVVRLARASDMTTMQIVRHLSGALPYREALKVAHEYAPLLEITVSEFMRLRKNERDNLKFFEAGDHRLAVSIAAEGGIIDLAVLAQEFLFDRFEQAVTRFQTGARVFLFFGCDGRRCHDS